jgi:hypothetical protein
MRKTRRHSEAVASVDSWHLRDVLYLPDNSCQFVPLAFNWHLSNIICIRVFSHALYIYGCNEFPIYEKAGAGAPAFRWRGFKRCG